VNSRRFDAVADAVEKSGSSSWPSARIVYLVVLALAMGVSLLYLSQTSDLAATSYDVAALQNEKSVWDMRNQQLRLQIAELESLDHVDQIASSRLHMGPPAKVVYVNAPPQAVSVATPTPSVTPVPGSLSATSLSGLIDRLGFGGRPPSGR